MSAKKMTEADRRHAALILSRNEDTRDWSDAEIASRCGLSAEVVAIIRNDNERKGD